MEEEIHDFIDLDEVAHVRCFLNRPYNRDEAEVIFRSGYGASFYDDAARFFFEQYTKHKKRKSIIHHCLITKVEK